MVEGREIGRLVELLRAEPGFERAELAGAPQPITGGFWASMSLVQLANVAPPLDTLVLRVMPDPALAAKETVFQREIARQGFPAPAVRLSGGADVGIGGAFMLMDRAPGAPALAGLDGIAALRRLPALAHRLPATLGQVTAALHALDPAPLQSALADAGVAAPSDAPAFLASLTESAGRLGRGDLRGVALWLAGHPPHSPRRVIAHGDLHPFNVLADGHPPLTATAPLRPVIAAAGAALARRFHHAYRRHGGIIPDRQTFGWYTSLHALRILTELHSWRHDSARSGHASHPWTTLAAVAASVLSRITSIAVAPRQ